MKPEPLREKKFDLSEFEKDQNGFIIPYWKGYNNGVNKAFKTFESAVVFYKRYRITEKDKSGAVRLYDEHRNVYDLWHKSIGELKVIDWDDMPTDLCYNDWIFNYCFADVIE